MGSRGDGPTLPTLRAGAAGTDRAEGEFTFPVGRPWAFSPRVFVPWAWRAVPGIS